MTPIARALVLTFAVASPLYGQTEQRSVKGSHVAIYNLVGRLRAVPGTGDDVTVELTRVGADAAKLRVEIGPVRGRETLRIVYPSDRIVYAEMRGSRTGIEVRDDGTFSDGDWRNASGRDRVDIRSRGPGLEAHVDLVVRVPRGKKIELFVAVGRVEVSNIEGDILLDVGSAEVEVSGTKGPLTLDTGSGRVAVRDVTGDVNVDAGSGGITLDRIKGDVLTLDSGSGGVQGSDLEVRELKADVGSGGLRLYRLKTTTVDVETGSGGALLELLSNVERLRIETGSGGVTVRAPATFSAEVNVETGSGGFQTDFEITTQRVGRNHIQGRIADGKGRVDIEAGSGTVRLIKN